MPETPRSNEERLTLVAEDWTDAKTGRTFRVRAGWTDDGRLAHIELTATDGGDIGPALWRRVPIGPITGRLADAVADLRAARASPQWARGEPVARFTGRTEAEPPKRGRPHERPDEFYERVAAEYRAATAVSGSAKARNYTATIAAALGDAEFTATQQNDPKAKAVRVRKWVGECRKRGLLPPA